MTLDQLITKTQQRLLVSIVNIELVQVMASRIKIQEGKPEE